MEAIFKSFEKDSDDAARLGTVDPMPIDEKMSLWLSKSGRDMQSSGVQENTQDQDPLNELQDVPDLEAYRYILLHSSAYTWLQSEIQKILNMGMEGDLHEYQQVRETVLSSIREGLQDHVEPKSVARGVQFVLPWIKGFMKSQEYPKPWSTVLPDVIVLTGSMSTAWASTLHQYLSSAWPNLGPAVLKLLQRLLDDETGGEHSC